MKRRIITWLLAITCVFSCMTVGDFGTISSKAANGSYINICEGCDELIHNVVTSISADGTVDYDIFLAVGTPAVKRNDGFFMAENRCSNDRFDWDVKVGDIFHSNYGKCSDAKVVLKKHNCAEFLKEKTKAATCTEDGTKPNYMCICYDCGMYYEDAAATKPIANIGQWVEHEGKVRHKGHNADITVDGNTLSMGKCSDCDASGGTIRLEVSTEGCLDVQIKGAVTFNRFNKNNISVDQVKYYKLVDGEYVKLPSIPDGYGVYYAELTVDGNSIRKDFVIRGAGSRHVVSETLIYAGVDTGEFSSENFTVVVPGKQYNMGGWQLSGAWNTTNTGTQCFEIKSKNGLVIKDVALFESAPDSFGYNGEFCAGNLRTHSYYNSKNEITLEEDGNMMFVENVNDTYLRIEPRTVSGFGLPVIEDANISKIVIYYEVGTAHEHTFDQENICEAALMDVNKDIYTYHKSCLCGEIGTDATNIFSVKVVCKEHNYEGQMVEVVGNGQHRVQCKVCDYYKYEDCVAGAKKVENNVSPSCGDDGSYDEVVRCQDCNQVLSTNTVTVEATGEHNYEGQEKEALENGQHRVQCKACDYYKYEDCVARASEVENEVPASCGKAGSYDEVVRCQDCNQVLSTNTVTVDATGAHDSSKVDVTPATDKLNGKRVVSCSVCGDILETSTIYAIGNVKLDKVKYVYTGKAIKPVVKVTNSKGRAISSANYTLSYDKDAKSVGVHNVKLTFKNDYKGTKTLTYTINPQATSLKSLSALRKGFKAVWVKKTAQVTGYELQYGTSSKFKSGVKTVKIKTASTISKKVTELKAGKKYFVRIRTFKTVSKKPYYSSWSAAKNVTVK